MHSLVVGGTKGLGRELAFYLAEKGHRVSCVARDISDPSMRRDRIALHSADLFQLDQVRTVLDRIGADAGKVDNLIFLQRYRSKDGEGPSWENEIQVSLKASQAVIEHLAGKGMFSKEGASIVFAASMGGSLYADNQPLEYAVTKAGIHQLIRFYSARLGARKIRVNGVSVFTFVKPGAEEHFRKAQELAEKTVPLGRMPSALDVAKTIGFFCSPESAMVSGQILVVDGALSAVGHETVALWASGMKEKPR